MNLRVEGNPSELKRNPMRGRRLLGALVAAALALAACGGDATNQAAQQPAEAPATTTPPAPVLQAISGNQVDFADILTQDTLLWFWAPW